ncbi:MAG: helix-turn-helix transcriptional regulator [Candidatus Eremiobacteraeota bacterium]|nr:helix-turn-helix transcriptional regulator [Candidatus Eremiobacteraeota bacterium]
MLVLASLNAGVKHGYAIILDIEEHSGERLGPGTLYGVVARLEAVGFIVPLEVEERGRRPYRITAAGRKALVERLDQYARYHRVLTRLAAKRT